MSPPSPLRPLAAVLLACAALLVIAACGSESGGDDRGDRVTPTPTPAPLPKVVQPAQVTPSSGPKLVEPEAGIALGGDQLAPEDASPDQVRAPSDDEIRAALSDAGIPDGPRAAITRDGNAIAPLEAPDSVRAIITAGNQIARFPYVYGGGHARWRDSAYDCSGSISFALAAAGLVSEPMVSGDFATWGKRGRGKWVTIYANDGHAYMEVAGLRFDTSFRGKNRSRWQTSRRTGAGFSVRHPPGL